MRRFYKVKCAESLEGIALRQLGDESRADEIKELNVDLIKYHGDIYPFNPGDVIRLPIEEREQFEKVFSQMPYEFDLRRYPEDSPKWPGGYVSYYVQCAWDAWQERAKIEKEESND